MELSAEERGYLAYLLKVDLRKKIHNKEIMIKKFKEEAELDKINYRIGFIERLYLKLQGP
jgi:hypothetical protein